MILSRRLDAVEGFISPCTCVADIGTDHAYLPIKLIEDKVCKKVIATDINSGPIEKAKVNIRQNAMQESIITRIGGGLSVLKSGEADAIIISGMGGHMIKSILIDDLSIAKSSKYIVLQPVQHPDVVRKTLKQIKFGIINENIVKDDNKYYHIIKAAYSDEYADNYTKEAEYILGIRNIENKHPLLGEYIDYRIKLIDQIETKIDKNEQYARFEELEDLKKQFQEVRSWL